MSILFDEYDFKTFAKVVRKVNNRFKSREIRQLYASSLYPEIHFYVKIMEKLREQDRIS